MHKRDALTLTFTMAISPEFLDWLGQSEVTTALVNELVSQLEARKPLDSLPLDYLRKKLSEAPFNSDKLGKQSKSQDVLISLWNTMKSTAADQAQAKAGFLLEMWGDSGEWQILSLCSCPDSAQHVHARGRMKKTRMPACSTQPLLQNFKAIISISSAQ